MIENAKILTGSPEKVEDKMNEYLASHPAACVLSSSVTTSEALAPVTEETKSSAKAGQAKTKTITTVCVIVGLKL